MVSKNKPSKKGSPKKEPESKRLNAHRGISQKTIDALRRMQKRSFKSEAEELREYIRVRAGDFTTTKRIKISEDIEMQIPDVQA